MELGVLDKGFVELLGIMGNDFTPVEAARVSFNKDIYKDENRNVALLSYLYENKHLATLEHVVLRFRVKAPIFCFRQWMRHRIGSFNERSGRYTEFDEDEYYIPKVTRLQDDVNKQGSVVCSDLHIDARFKAEVEHISNSNYQCYLKLLEIGVAKELARIILPVNFYSEMIWTVNLRSLFNFLELRLDNHAQYEIRQYAETILELIKESLPHNYEMFKKFILKEKT